MKRLTGVAELLDGPLDDPATLAANLRDLARINRLTGGTRLSERAIAALGGGAYPARRRNRRRRHPDDAPRPGARPPVAGWSSPPRTAATRSSRRPAELGPRSSGRAAWSSRSPTVVASPTPTARSTSPTPRWSSTTWSRTRRSRSCASCGGSLGAGSSSTTSSAAGSSGSAAGSSSMRSPRRATPGTTAPCRSAARTAGRSCARWWPSRGCAPVAEFGGFAGHRVAIAAR